ncbi:hypothetical protein PENARI_c073G11746 [Penicillium arizonense]|uniref:Uncharacterized protein n=1 Tax=Penicillium arizonense TaxID=1835702 RepID=A0A1F5L250_PENAI|nr:hypothetical protein PENARI_c073G11746 [Penicillium arizonense]OGE47039.1 hypothetical protein PENARI_c073G11746 [Penicillium arizonense]
MSDVERQLAILLEALVQTNLEFICPQCYQLFPDIAACYRHCREAGEGEGGDDIHKGLGLITKKDFPEFLRCYRVAIGFPIAECDLPLGDGPGRRSYNQCFSVDFVLGNCLPSRETMDAMLLAVIKV